MLSQKLHDAMNAQINAELWSAYLYLSMALDAENKGYKGIANWFHVQFQEEQAHARIFINYLHSRDAKVELKPIEEVPTTWCCPLEMFKQTLEHEKTGFIYQGGNVDALVATIERFLAMPNETRQKMGEAGRERVKAQFSREFVIKAYKEKISELLK